MIKKEEIRRFTNQYMCNFISDERVKAFETITRYISYDMDLVLEDKERINKFLMDNFADDTKVFPGHGCSTTIGTERMHNPYIINHIN